MSYCYNTKVLYYCTDCYNLWRTVYQKRLSLTLFVKHVKHWPGRCQYIKEFVAWLVLSKDGSLKHVRKEHIERKVAQLEFAFELLGVPWPFFEVKELNEETAASMTRPIFDLMKVTVLHTGGQRRVAQLVPFDADSFREEAGFPKERMLLTPNRAQQTVRVKIPTDCPTAMNLWARLGGGGGRAPFPALKDGAMDVDNDDGGASADQGAATGTSKLSEFDVDPKVSYHHQMVHTLKERMVITFADYSTGAAFETKEKPFTSLTTKALSAQHQCTQSKYSAELLPIVRRFISAIESGKSSLKPFQKYKERCDRGSLGDLLKVKGPLVDLFKNLGEVFAPEILEIFWRADFPVCCRPKEQRSLWKSSRSSCRPPVSCTQAQRR